MYRPAAAVEMAKGRTTAFSKERDDGIGDVKFSNPIV